MQYHPDFTVLYKLLEEMMVNALHQLASITIHTTKIDRNQAWHTPQTEGHK